jgi:hypothetical protein
VAGEGAAEVPVCCPSHARHSPPPRYPTPGSHRESDRRRATAASARASKPTRIRDLHCASYRGPPARPAGHTHGLPRKITCSRVKGPWVAPSAPWYSYIACSTGGAEHTGSGSADSKSHSSTTTPARSARPRAACLAPLLGRRTGLERADLREQRGGAGGCICRNALLCARCRWIGGPRRACEGAWQTHSLERTAQIQLPHVRSPTLGLPPRPGAAS